MPARIPTGGSDRIAYLRVTDRRYKGPPVITPTLASFSSRLRDTISSNLSMAAATALTLALSLTATAARAELESHGPAFTFGYSDDRDFTESDQTLRHYLPGWRFTFGDFHSWDVWLGDRGMNLSWVIDTSAGYIGGDRDTVEVTVLPLFHLEPAASMRWFPFLEGGVGLTYNDARGFDLGSQILFSDQIGAGLAYKTDNDARVGALYRIRHISHAGLWADSNDGLNTHMFQIFYEFGAD